MKCSGMVRKIDELGRIVIPKEIRKNINIHDGEELEILIENNNIILKKNDSIFANIPLLKKLCNIFKKYNDVDLAFTNHDQVLVSSNDYYENMILDKEYQELIDNRESIKINKENKYYFMKPLIIDGNALGLLIVIGNQEFDTNILNSFNILFDTIIALYDID